MSQMPPHDLELLLDINNAITTIHRKDNLFKAIAEKLRPIFKFEVFVVVVLDKERKYFKLFLRVEAREAETAMQLAIANALATIKNRDEMFLAVAAEINKVVPNSFMGIRVQRPSGIATAYANFFKQPDGTFALMMWLRISRRMQKGIMNVC